MDHNIAVITAYKVARSDGTDYRTGRVRYEPGETLTVENAAPPEAGCCQPGLHLSTSPREACEYISRGYGPRARFFECLVDVNDLLAVDDGKMRVRSLYVLREVPFDEVFGEGFHARIAAVREDVETWKKSRGFTHRGT